MKTTLKLCAGLILLLMISCSDNSNPKPADDNPDDTPSKSKMEMLMGKWLIDEATHDGDPDASSLNKTVTFESNGSYDFDGGFSGNYHWSQDSTAIHLDAGTQWSQDWILIKFTDEELDVDFFSPFTGKPSQWKMQKTW